MLIVEKDMLLIECLAMLFFLGNHHNFHVRGFMENGTTTTPFDMAVINGIDRFHLVSDVIERVPSLQSKAAYLNQHVRDQLIAHRYDAIV